MSQKPEDYHVVGPKPALLFPVDLRDQIAGQLADDAGWQVPQLEHYIAAESIIEKVCRWFQASHDDGRPLGEIHGWASRYAGYLLAGGDKHRRDESTHAIDDALCDPS